MKKFFIKNHLMAVAVLAGLALILDFLIPGLNFFGSNFGRQPTASLVVDYGQGGIRRFSGEVTEQMTVLEALLASSLGGLKMEYGQNKEGLTLLSVDGRSGPLKIMLNGRLIPAEEVGRTAVNRGDLIKVELP